MSCPKCSRRLSRIQSHPLMAKFALGCVACGIIVQAVTGEHHDEIHPHDYRVEIEGPASFRSLVSIGVSATTTTSSSTSSTTTTTT